MLNNLQSIFCKSGLLLKQVTTVDTLVGVVPLELLLWKAHI